MTTTQSANGRRVEGIEKYFWAITRYPKLIIAAGFIGILAMAASLPALVKDTTPDAFIAKDNPAVVRSWPTAAVLLRPDSCSILTTAYERIADVILRSAALPRWGR